VGFLPLFPLFHCYLSFFLYSVPFCMARDHFSALTLF
jgi:hypothetical protein